MRSRAEGSQYVDLRVDNMLSHLKMSISVYGLDGLWTSGYDILDPLASVSTW